MVSTIITPQKSRVSLSVPASYIGRQVEVSFVLIDKNDNPKPPKQLSENKSFSQLFSKTRGMWRDYDIDGNKLRNEAWGLNEKTAI